MLLVCIEKKKEKMENRKKNPECRLRFVSERKKKERNYAFPFTHFTIIDYWDKIYIRTFDFFYKT